LYLTTATLIARETDLLTSAGRKYRAGHNNITYTKINLTC